MNHKKIVSIVAAILLGIGALSINLSAQNRQEYRMNKSECAHYVQLSREMVDKNNLQLAKVYAKKAVQANPWEKAAWASYNDVVQRLADDGDIQDFDTFIEESQAASVPAAGGGANKFEGC
jgi:Tfp pilus assembly protein PilF